MNNNYIPVEGNPNLVRDKTTNAILNTNAEAWEAFKRDRGARRQNQKLLDKIPRLEKDIYDMKIMLEMILTKLS